MSAPTDLDDPTVVALFLLSVAARPLPPAFEDADYFQIDRAELWKLAFAANVPLGRNTFHATVAAIAEETEAVTVDRFVGSNRRFVRLGIPEADEYTWLNEIFAELEFDDLSAAIDAAADRGFDTETALPTELALPVSQGAEERHRDREAGGWDDYDDEAPELTEKACTKCGAVQPLREFPERSTGRLSSWCRSCHRAATEDWKKRNPGHDRDNTSYLRYGDRSWDEITAAQPHQKWCPRCRRVLYTNAFTHDRYRPDGLSTYCRACRHRDRVERGPYEPRVGARTDGFSFGPAGW